MAKPATPGSPKKLLRYDRSQYAAYLAGCASFSYGASCFIESDLGTDPLDVFALGLLEHLPLTIGIAQALFAALCIAVWAAWNRRRPVISPFVTFFFCGSLIDVARAADLAALPVDPAVLMVLGSLLCAYGSSLIILGGIGIRAMDLVAISMTEHWRIPFWAAKFSTELLLLASGWLLGGPVGIGTVCFLVVVDLLVQPLMRLNGNVLRLRNAGIPSLSVAKTPA
ncbi:YitT family protein [Streptomyces sp. NPDC048751]|uniref:YczE/YyaS/YitT family protein n=1 Tax=Streptomyces sp. NPDC048751 TaxID=3365591 RepID=UPI0037101F24